MVALDVAEVEFVGNNEGASELGETFGATDSDETGAALAESELDALGLAEGVFGVIDEILGIGAALVHGALGVGELALALGFADADVELGAAEDDVVLGVAEADDGSAEAIDDCVALCDGVALCDANAVADGELNGEPDADWVLDALAVGVAVALAELDELGAGVGIGVKLGSGFGINDVGTHRLRNVLASSFIFLAVSPLTPGMMSSE